MAEPSSSSPQAMIGVVGATHRGCEAKRVQLAPEYYWMEPGSSDCQESTPCFGGVAVAGPGVGALLRRAVGGVGFASLLPLPATEPEPESSSSACVRCGDTSSENGFSSLCALGSDGALVSAASMRSEGP